MGLPRPYYEDARAGIVIYHGDCRDLITDLSSIELVITDPPYSFGMASTAQEAKGGSWADLMNAAAWYASWMRECQRLTTNRQGAMWIFNSWRSFPILGRAAYETPWPIESLLVWDKQWIGPGGLRGLRPSYELVALFCHPLFALKNRGLPDIWPAKWGSFKPSGHPAEKPVPLLRQLMRESGGRTVLDPFLGSGSTLVAAKSEGLSAIGIEAEERWCETAAQRLAQEVLPVNWSA